MKNEYWIFSESEMHSQLVIDVYDQEYIKLSREERLNELKSFLLNDIMDIKSVRIQWENNGYLLDLKKSWTDIERIEKIQELLEEAYTWLIPWFERNSVLEDGSLVLDDIKDNSHLSHYKKAKL